MQATLNAPMPTATPRPAVAPRDPALAESLDPRRLSAEPNAYLDRNVELEGRVASLRNDSAAGTTWLVLEAVALDEAHPVPISGAVMCAEGLRRTGCVSSG